MARQSRARLTATDRLAITELKAQGKPHKTIAKLMNCDKSTVTRVISEDRPDLRGRASAVALRQSVAPEEEELAGANSEIKYLVWAATGGIRGWVDRLILDIESGRLG